MSAPHPSAVPASPAAAAPASAALRSFEAQWRARESDSLAPLRGEAMRRFLRLGLPTLRDESWRYTNLRRLAARSFVDAPRIAPAAIVSAPASNLLDPSACAAGVLMVNGHPLLPAAAGALGASGTARGDLEIQSLRELARTDADLLAHQLGPLSDAEESRFELLNTALFQDGLHIRIKRPLPAPLMIVHLAAAASPDGIAHPRIIVEACEGSSATIIEHHVQQGEYAPLLNSATRILLGPAARIEHYRVFSTGPECTHIDSLEARLQRDSELRQFTVVLGGALVRASLDARLEQPGAVLESHSLLVGHGERHVDCVNVATHAAPRTRSRQTARAIAGGTSRVIVNSKVVVDPGAAQAHSQQSCRGLLLSSSAEIDSRPQLEIHADEVKCAHGATIGRLDPDMLFYMLSRGLDRDTAQSLLVFAFLADVMTGMSVRSARSAVENALIAQLPNSQLLRGCR